MNDKSLRTIRGYKNFSESERRALKQQLLTGKERGCFKKPRYSCFYIFSNGIYDATITYKDGKQKTSKFVLIRDTKNDN